MWVILLALAAADDTDARARHLDLAARAHQAEAAGAYDVAARACAAAIEADASGPRAARCARRVAWLDARRDDDGTLRTFEAFDALRREQRHRDPDAVRTEVLALAGAEGATSTTLAEIAHWLAQDALLRRGDAESARATLSSWHARRDELPSNLSATITQAYAVALAQLGRMDEANAVESDIRIPTRAPRPTLVQQEARRQRNDGRRKAAWAALAVFGVAAAPAGWRAGKPRVPWRGLTMLMLLAAGTALIAEGWADGAAAAVPWMLTSFILIHLIASHAVRGAGLWHPALRALAAIATGAAAWLALDHTATLEWIGQ